MPSPTQTTDLATAVRSERAGDRQASRDAARRPVVQVAPTAWAEPRQGARFWPTALGPEPTCPLHRSVVSAHAELVQRLDGARPYGSGLRRLARDAGLSLSVVEAALAGRCWPSVETLGRLAVALGHRMVLADPKPLEFRTVTGARPAAPPDRQTRETVAGTAGDLPAVWHDLLLDEVWWRLDAQKVSASKAAAQLRLRPNTVSESRHARAAASGPWVRTPVLAALAGLTGAAVQVTPRDRAWPRAAWEQFGTGGSGR